MNNILLSSLGSINKCNLYKEVKVDFIGDKVQDAGGLLREWLLLLFKELTHPNLGLFMLAETEDVCYRINPDFA
jgi:E3 ubiquitin-protein ligase HUWE1